MPLILKNMHTTKRYGIKREELQIGDRFCIGHVGRFAEQKNHAYLIDIFYEVHKKKEDAVLLLVGDGPLQEDVKSQGTSVWFRRCGYFCRLKG